MTASRVPSPLPLASATGVPRKELWGNSQFNITRADLGQAYSKWQAAKVRAYTLTSLFTSGGWTGGSTTYKYRVTEGSSIQLLSFSPSSPGSEAKDLYPLTIDGRFAFLQDLMDNQTPARPPSSNCVVQFDPVLGYPSYSSCAAFAMDGMVSTLKIIQLEQK